ncbi:MAG: PP2C family protein-serine/threonine phosphatase [Myxococcota bacterium]
MRLPIGVKMTLASTLLVALLVTVLGYLHAVKIRDIQAERAEEMTEAFHKLAIRRAESSAAVLAVALRDALEGTELGTLDSVARRLVEQDPQVLWAKVADREGRVLADSEERVHPGDLARLEPPDGGSLLGAALDEIRDDQGRRVLRVRQPILAPQTGDVAPEPRGALVFAYDLSPLEGKLAQIDDARLEGTRDSLRYTFVIDGVALLLGALLSLVAAQRFTSPIRRLARTAGRIAQGDLGARVAISNSDEVGTLGAQFNHMAERVQRLLHETVAKAELERELNLAREIQSVLVPAPGQHEAPGLDVAGYYEPASSCGGDFWDFAALPRGRAALVVGDVTGHGVPAAMLTATAKASVDTLRQVHGEDLRVAETMRVLDRVIRDTGHGAFFMTAAVAVLDSARHTLYFASAGHPPGLLLRWTESGVKLHRLLSRGNRLGDATPQGYEAKRVRVAPGDLLVWYTDGLVEALDAEGNQFGARRLLRVLSRLESTAEPGQVVEAVSLELQRFRGEVPLEDDVTIVAGRIR